MDAVKCFTIVFLLGLCLGHDNGQHFIKHVLKPTCTVPQPFLSTSACFRRFYGRRINYYPNSDASYQISLLKDGDISPNPGPDVGCGSCDTAPKTITYTREQLYDVAHHDVCHQRLSPVLWKKLTTLGISHKKRTKRSKRTWMKRRNKILRSSLSTFPDDKSPTKDTSLTCISSGEADFSLVCNKGLKKGSQTVIGLWNARSLSNKTVCTCDLILDNNLDVLVVTESWLTGDCRDDTVIADLKSTLPNYEILHCPRKTSRGGGICVIHRSSATTSVKEIHKFSSFELLDLSIRFSPSSVLHLYAVYRPPPSSSNKLTCGMFTSEFFTLLESAAIDDNCPLIVGDFNIHVDNTSASYVRTFLGSLDSLGFQQHVQEPTHRAGHTIDLIISRRVDDIVSGIHLLSNLPSDHSAVIATIKTESSGNPRKRITYRKLQSIDICSFRQDILNSLVMSLLSSCPTASVNMYNMKLLDLLNKHAPVESKVITIKPKAPWYSEEIKEAKRCRRRAERLMQKSGLCIHKQLYKQECDSYYSKLFEAKSSYFKGEIAGSDSKQLFQIVKKLSSPLQSTTFPDHDSDEDLANRFGEFFENKVASIISSFNIPFSDDLLLPSQTGISHDSNLSEFDLVSEMQVKRVIKSLPSKFCSLDPLPTWLVKACLDELLPVITLIMNLSLSSGVVPESFKTACVLPLLKKPSLETNDFKNYRPIANLPFLSKVLERIVAAQLPNSP
nr:uncharacterized protein LOC129275690 [Lytechinus pictus]